MSLVRKTIENAAVGMGIAKSPEGLSAIHHPGCAAAIWQRSPLKGFQAWMDGLEIEQLPQARLILPCNNVQDATSQICETCGMPGCTERQRLVDDVAALAGIFGDLMQVTYLQLRLDVVAANALERFHIDAVRARLICTYRGSGTQYAVSVDGSEPHQVFTVPTGAPILLRGTRWPGDIQSGLLHRSPPMEDTGEARLVLTLEPLDERQEKPAQKTVH